MGLKFEQAWTARAGLDFGVPLSFGKSFTSHGLAFNAKDGP